MDETSKTRSLRNSRLACLAAASLIFSACRSAPQVMRYSWGDIVIADGNTLDEHCSPIPGKWDDGKKRGQWADVIGCYDAATRQIWVEDSCAGAMALTHELAHMDGVADPAKLGYNWGQGANAAAGQELAASSRSSPARP